MVQLHFRADPNSNYGPVFLRQTNRIVKSRRDELLDSMRAIINGVAPTFVDQVPLGKPDPLYDFIETSAKCWRNRVADLPQKSSPRFSNGYYDCAFHITGSFETPKMRDLRDKLKISHRNHTGWSAFFSISGNAFAPQIVENAIESWRGLDEDGRADSPHRHDFWRVSPEGMMFTRRGYSEDGMFDGMEPGKFFDITTPTRRLADAVLQAVYLAEELGAEDGELRCVFRFNGLKGRKLTNKGNPRRLLMSARKTEQPTYDAEVSVPLKSLPDALPELVEGILAPLYEHFEFFPLSKNLVEEEIADLLRHRF